MITVLRAVWLVAACAAAANVVHAQAPGVTANEIVIGYTGPQTGPFAAFGAIGKGIEAYWKNVNEAGGIHGRKVKFISADDKGDPAVAAKEARRLIDDEKVFALFNNYGTAANLAIRPIANAAKVPQLFVASPSPLMADPERFPWTMGWEPSYDVEARAFIVDVLTRRPKADIALLVSGDIAGQIYEEVITAEVKSKGTARVTTVRYVAGIDLKSTIDKFKSSGATAFITNVSDPRLIGLLAAIGANWQVYAGRASLDFQAYMRGPDSSFKRPLEVITSVYLKDPRSSLFAEEADTREWLAWMSKYNPGVSTANPAYVYAYAVSATMKRVLEASGANPTRETLLEQATNLKGFSAPMLLPGITVSTGKSDYRPIQSVRLQRYGADNRLEVFLPGASVGGGDCPGGATRCANKTCPPPPCSIAP